MDHSTHALNICEVFVSIQGEGRDTGVPAIFVRTAGCNLRCQWGQTRCDTAYASWAGEGTTMSLADVLAAVMALREAHPRIHRAVITGGEPMLQPALDLLVVALKRRHLSVALETNGTIAGRPAVDFMSISPKLSSSTPVGLPEAAAHEANRLRPEVLRELIANYDYQLKFVVDRATDEAEIAALLEELGNIPLDRVHVMPQGTSYDQLMPRARLCVDMCLRRGWRYSPRVHIELFNNVRGH